MAASAYSSPVAVLEEVRALEELGLDALRERWRGLIGPPPKLRSPELLRLLLAWRIQTAAFGGLDVETRRHLRLRRSTATPATPDGSTLVREWQGLRLEVHVRDGSYQFAGKSYSSLSKIAREVTGVRWNGPKFFGLRAPIS